MPTIGPLYLLDNKDDGENLYGYSGSVMYDGEGGTIYPGEWAFASEHAFGWFKFTLGGDDQIPAGSTIDSVYLTLDRDSAYNWDTSRALGIRIGMDFDVDNISDAEESPLYGSSARALSTAHVRWPTSGGIDWDNLGNSLTTPNLASLLQEYLDALGGNMESGHRITFWISVYELTSGDNYIGIRDSSNGGNPSLTIEFTAPGGASYTLTADAGSLTITGYAAGIRASRKLTADVSSLTLSGHASALLASRKLTADNSSLSITGNTANLLASRKLTVDADSLSITGYDVNFFRGRNITADSASLTITGYNTGLIASRKLSAEQSALSITGYDSGLRASRLLTADTESLTINFHDASLLCTRLLHCESDSLAITGYDVQLLIGIVYRLMCETGSLTINGYDVSLLASRLLNAQTSGLTITGYDVDLIVSVLAHYLLTCETFAMPITSYPVYFRNYDPANLTEDKISAGLTSSNPSGTFETIESAATVGSLQPVGIFTNEIITATIEVIE